MQIVFPDEDPCAARWMDQKKGLCGDRGSRPLIFLEIAQASQLIDAADDQIPGNLTPVAAMDALLDQCIDRGYYSFW